MAASFMTLPREIRYHIYGYLCDGKCRVYLTTHKHLWRMESAHVDTALGSQANPTFQVLSSTSRHYPWLDLFPLLRICRQVSQETISLLYTQAVFWFQLEDPDGDYLSPYNLSVFPDESLQMIQNFHIIIKKVSLKFKPSHILDIFAYLENGNALRRLTLRFHCISEPDCFGKTCHTWMKALVAQTGIPKMIAALESLHHLQIIMSDRNPEMKETFAPFVRQLEMAIGVAHDSKRWGFRLVSYEWTWHLRQALNKSSEAT